MFCLSLAYVFLLQRGPAFVSELLSVIPNAQYYKRGTHDLKKVLFLFFLVFEYTSTKFNHLKVSFDLYVLQIVEYAKNRDFTSVMVVHTNRREPG